MTETSRQARNAHLPVATEAATPDLSVILPSYRSARLAQRSVHELTEMLGRCRFSWEVIVVDDGAHDFAPGAFDDEPHVRLVVLPSNRGKGAAVRAGLRAARGHARVFTDVDLPYEPHLILVCMEYLLVHRYHMVVGDRTLPGSRYGADVGLPRRLASALFSAFVGKLVTGGFFDTQCGLKGFRGDVADSICAMARIDRFAFDVELIYLGLKHRLDIKRIPVRLRSNETSSVRLIRDSVRMLADVFRMKFYQMRGRYRSEELAWIVTSDVQNVSDRIVARGADPRSVTLPNASDPAPRSAEAEPKSIQYRGR